MALIAAHLSQVNVRHDLRQCNTDRTDRPANQWLAECRDIISSSAMLAGWEAEMPLVRLTESGQRHYTALAVVSLVWVGFALDWCGSGMGPVAQAECVGRETISTVSRRTKLLPFSRKMMSTVLQSKIQNRQSSQQKNLHSYYALMPPPSASLTELIHLSLALFSSVQGGVRTPLPIDYI